jgi:hypothetical protein
VRPVLAGPILAYFNVGGNFRLHDTIVALNLATVTLALI